VATVTLVVRDHGPANPGRVDDQVYTFGARNPTCHDPGAGPASAQVGPAGHQPAGRLAAALRDVRAVAGLWADFAVLEAIRSRQPKHPRQEEGAMTTGDDDLNRDLAEEDPGDPGISRPPGW
jgi:hypothetical protein